MMLADSSTVSQFSFHKGDPMFILFKHFIREEDGQDFAEYASLVFCSKATPPSREKSGSFWGNVREIPISVVTLVSANSDKAHP